jgi:hypothetical protein
MKRCLAQLSLSGRGFTELLQPGMEVNLDRELAPGFTVADAIAGRENCFEDVDEDVPLELPAPTKKGTKTAPQEGASGS